MTTTYGRKMERGNQWLATLHWYDRVPSRLNYERRFWVGLLNQCIHLLPSCREVRRETEPWCADVCQRRLGPRSSNDPAPPSSSTVPPLGLWTPPCTTTTWFKIIDCPPDTRFVDRPRATSFSERLERRWRAHSNDRGTRNANR